jgi:hypothetical protein
MTQLTRAGASRCNPQKWFALLAIVLVAGIACSSFALSDSMPRALPAPEETRVTGVLGDHSITFKTVAPPDSASSTRVLGLPPFEGWAVIVAVILVGALVVAWVVLRVLRRGPVEDTFDSSGRPAK